MIVQPPHPHPPLVVEMTEPEQNELAAWQPSSPHYRVTEGATFVAVPIEEIETWEGMARPGAPKVLRLMGLMQRGAPLPPLHGFRRDYGLWNIGDGLHRFYASVALGFPMVPIDTARGAS